MSNLPSGVLTNLVTPLNEMQLLFLVIGLFFLSPIQTASAGENSVTKILILGDSLSAAYNIPVEQSWPEIFSSNIRTSFAQTSVVNASISGETTFGGLQRLERLLDKHHPSHLIIELGGNDGLRGLDFRQTKQNLNQMISLATRQSIAVMIIGVRMPPNFGAAYNQRFQQIFETVSAQHNIHYLPKFLEGIALGGAKYMQNDGIHPTAAAQPMLADKVLNAFKALMAQL